MKKNKGFSLVEIIIVVAIMAILVGVMTPQLIKYIEKSKVAADKSTLDVIYQAVMCAISDPDVILDPSVDGVMDKLSSPIPLEELMSPAGNKLALEICDSIGWSDINQSTYVSHLRSAHTSDSQIYFYYDGKLKNPVVMWITHTDASGGKNTSHAPTTVSKLPDDLEGCIAIY